jgi:hypothetical protein
MDLSNVMLCDWCSAQVESTEKVNFDLYLVVNATNLSFQVPLVSKRVQDITIGLQNKDFLVKQPPSSSSAFSSMVCLLTLALTYL